MQRDRDDEADRNDDDAEKVEEHGFHVESVREKGWVAAQCELRGSCGAEYTN
jgi:hypothetical protein